MQLLFLNFSSILSDENLKGVLNRYLNNPPQFHQKKICFENNKIFKTISTKQKSAEILRGLTAHSKRKSTLCRCIKQ